MAIDSTHPKYDEFLPDWTTCEDTFRGERAVKSRGVAYLPATSGQIEDGQGSNNSKALGELAYQAYKTRALFQSFMGDGVEVLLGIMHRKPPVIKLPKKMEPMRKEATVNKESLPLLLRKINEQQLVTGRLGLLADLPKGKTENAVRPWIALYEAKHIINWDDGSRSMPVAQRLNLVVLDETESVRTEEFEWEEEEKFRVLSIGDMTDTTPKGEYRVRLVSKADTKEEQEFIPKLMGKTLKDIPFQFINTLDLVPEPDDPPLIGLANLALAYYRGDADYRQALFMQGQATLKTIGGEEDHVYRVGANASINMPIGGDADFIGADHQGIPEMRKGQENLAKIAAIKGAQLIDTTSRQRESGDALRIRVSAQTATLNQVVMAGAEGLQETLRTIGRWMGMSQEEVEEQIIVEPNQDFTDDELSGKTLTELMEAKHMGAPLALEDIHALTKKHGLTERPFEEVMALIAGEEPIQIGTGAGGDSAEDS